MAKKPVAGMMLEEAVEYALRDMGAIGGKTVRTQALARRLHRLGCPIAKDTIARKLHQSRGATWARRFIRFIGGTPDEFEAFAWAINGE
jgi:hypothetical protein